MDKDDYRDMQIKPLGGDGAMRQKTKRRPDLAPVPWLALAFLLGVSAGLLLAMNQTADAAEESQAQEERPAVAATVEPLPETASAVVIQEEPVQPRLDSLGLYKVTAYCPCEQCCGKTDGITATGTTATQGRTIAVDPSVIPYGSVVYFEGMDGCIGGYVAEDCGGAIKGNRIDLFCEDHETALEWGVREMEVYTIEQESE